MKYRTFFEKTDKKSIYLIIVLVTIIIIVSSDYVFNLSNNKNISNSYQNISGNLSNNTNNIILETNSLFLIVDSDNFRSWLTTISNIGTFIAALIALFTLVELKKQRQLSDTPKILFSSRENNYEIFWTKKEELDFTLPVCWKNKSTKETMGNDVLPSFSIPLEVINAGSSPALKMKVKWKMDSTIDLINSFNKIGSMRYWIDEEDIIPSHNILIGKKIYGYPINSTHTQEIEYILPYSNIENREKIFLPFYFPTLISLALTDYSLTKDSTNLRFPHLVGLVEYLDLSSTIHKSEFYIELYPCVTKLIKEANYEEGFKSATISINVKMKKRDKYPLLRQLKFSLLDPIFKRF